MAGSAKFWPLFTSKTHFKPQIYLLSYSHLFLNRFRTDHGWRRMDFTSPARMDRHIEMMMAIEKALIHAKCLVQPAIYIMPEVDKGIVGMF